MDDAFIQLSGEDGTFAPYLGQGGHGIITVAGNVAPELYVKMYDAWCKNDMQTFAETRDYVPKVLAAFQVARGLCLTPPELISDGCVFAAMN